MNISKHLPQISLLLIVSVLLFQEASCKSPTAPDTVQIVDTVKIIRYIKVYDTLRYFEPLSNRKLNLTPVIKEKKMSPIRIKKHELKKELISIEANYSEGLLYGNQYQNGPGSSKLTGIWLRTEGRNLFLKGGLCYNQLNFSQVATQYSEIYDTTFQTTITPYDVMNIDTIEVVDISNYPEINIITYYDTTYQTLYDTATSSTTDTSSVTENYRTNAKIHYLNIPLMVGYKWSYKLFQASIASGFGLGIPIATNGKIISSEKSLLPNEKSLYSTIQMTFINQLTLSYQFTENLFAGVNFNANFIVTPLFINRNNPVYTMNWGVHLGYVLDRSTTKKRKNRR